MGTIKLRTRAEGDVTNVRMLIRHPMKIEKRDKKTGKVVPPHFIQKVVVSRNGETIMEADCGQAVSVNPYFNLALKGISKGDTLKVAWKDNQNKSDAAEFKVG